MIQLFNGPTRALGYAMRETTTATQTTPADEPVDSEVLEFRANFEASSPLDEIIREGARRMLQAAIDVEVDEFVTQHADRRDEQGRRQVVRNGRLPTREILTGAGPLEVSQPRVRDKSPQEKDRVTFSPSVLPRYLRRTKAIEELIPWLYLVRRARRQARQRHLHGRLFGGLAVTGRRAGQRLECQRDRAAQGAVEQRIR